MLRVFAIGLDHRLRSANLPASVTQSLQSQSIKLAAIDIPKSVSPGMHQLIRRAIDESFMAGFRFVMVIGAALAAGSAVTALFWVGGATAARSVEKKSPRGR